MTKFEEDLNEKLNSEKVPMYITQNRCSLTRKTFIETNWLFANYGNYHSDEEFQEHVLANKNLIDVSTKLAEEIANLKSQLQQQALPVVPSFVAEWIEILKTKGLKPLKNPETYGETGFTEEKIQNIVFWISEHQEDYMRAWLDGYTVEKPQLFYLCEKNTGYYLRKTGTDWYGITSHYSNDYDENYMNYKFTQQEIDRIDTGSYELVPVEDGE